MSRHGEAVFAARAGKPGRSDLRGREASSPARVPHFIILAGSLTLLAVPAFAAPIDAFGFVIEGDQQFLLALFAFTLGTAMLAAGWLIRQKSLLAAENAWLRGELSDARSSAETRLALLAADDQAILTFANGMEPALIGSLPDGIGAPEDVRPFLGFAAWLPGSSAVALASAIERLRAAAEPFVLFVETRSGTPVEARGTTRGGLAVVRFTPLGGIRAELARLRSESARVVATVETMQNLFDAIPMPVWLRDETRRLVWVNRAYASAVESETPGDALERQVEFFNEQGQATIRSQIERDGLFGDKLTAVVQADRRIFDVVDASGPFGTAGIAIDISESEQIRMELAQTIESHSETLDRLTTAVARFDAKMQLTHYNAAFQVLFDLNTGCLESKPDHLSLVDHFRSSGILPEDRTLSDWKTEISAAYRAAEPTETMWHLADGRTLRVFASPQPQGGATWVFEDLTEKLELESRLNSLVRLQGETLDFLSEAVGVFGPDGRLRLSNPTFCEMWGVSEEFAKAKPHVRAIAETASISILPAQDGARAFGWRDFVQAVTAFDEGPREAQTGEIELSDGTVQNYAVVPLPGGQTMLTFIDISGAKRAEAMLRERNEALEHAYRLKTDFVQHVNYELRSPLTNIIGFSALLRSRDTGPLNERQSEYLDYISTSTSTLLTIVNDILDLATIDAGIMELDVSQVDIAGTAEHAADAIRDRLRENGIALEVDVAKAGATFRADGHRITQILFNLLSNAANFAPAGSTVRLEGWREKDTIVMAVSDEGPGIPQETSEKVFERFESDPLGGRQSGAGLGLSIVKSFVELHHGTVSIRSDTNKGTTVFCRFPAELEFGEEAAE